jgi:hypothetical protein
MVTAFYIKDRWQAVKDWFNPRQKWLTNVIPNHWCDKTQLVPICLFQILINFVEEENGLDQLNVDWEDEIKNGHCSPEYVASVMLYCTELKAVYDYITAERLVLEQAFVDSYPEVDISGNGFSTKEPFEVAYRENNRLEKLLEEKDMHAMMTIVKHRKILWT